MKFLDTVGMLGERSTHFQKVETLFKIQKFKVKFKKIKNKNKKIKFKLPTVGRNKHTVPSGPCREHNNGQYGCYKLSKITLSPHHHCPVAVSNAMLYISQRRKVHETIEHHRGLIFSLSP